MSEQDFNSEDSDHDAYFDDSVFHIEYSDNNSNQSLNFFLGSLQDAIQIEHCPILIYLYHDQDQSHKNFDEKILSSTEIIKYLNSNYVVWSYEITYDVQKDMLDQMWKQIFSIRFFQQFQIDKCPLLIGIMRLFQKKTETENTFDYGFKTLMENDTITRTHEKINSENLLNELVDFTNEFNKNELNLSFDISKKTGLPLEIILDIAEYLTYNEAVSAFPINVFYSLRATKSINSLLNPFDSSIEKYLSRIDHDQIYSLQWNTDKIYTNDKFQSLSRFKNVTSITFRNPLEACFGQIKQYKQHLPSLTRIHLFYDATIDYYRLYHIIRSIENIKYLEVSCPGLFCSSENVDYIKRNSGCNITILVFLFDFRRIPHLSLNNFMPIDNLMKLIPNIQSIRLKIPNHHLNLFLDDYVWQIGTEKCLHLKKITLEIYEHDPKMKKYFAEKAHELEVILRRIRKTLQFRIVLL